MSGADPEAEGRGNVRDPGIDLITKHFDAKPRDAVSRAFQQDCEYLFRKPTTEQVRKR